MEANDLSLDENTLNDLDSESENPDHIKEPEQTEEAQQDTPLNKFTVGEQLITIKKNDLNLGIHLTCSTPDQIANIAIWLYNQIKNGACDGKENPNYTA